MSQGIFPDSTLVINFGYAYNQNLDNVFPNNVHTISISWRYCYQLTDDMLPKSLRTIKINRIYKYLKNLVQICEKRQIMIQFLE